MSLRIQSIHLENFKSWYGQHKIDLDANKFMAIVGANGSGKSNIIDALLFVFGWRAKQLRQPKLTDLIHYSEHQPDYARVQIDFINQGQCFSIARQVRRNGSNNYEVNGQKASLEAVTKILLDNGLDIHHNRFLILQGEVESISMMKPSGDDSLNQLTQQQLLNIQMLRDLVDKLGIEFDPTAFDTIYQNIYENQQQLLTSDELQQLFNKIIPIQIYQQQLQSSETGLLEFIEQIIGTQESIPQIAHQAALVQFIDLVKQEQRNQLNQLITYRDQLNNAKDEAVVQIKKYFNEYVSHYNSVIYDTSNNRFIIQTKKDENEQYQQQINKIEQEQNISELKQQIKNIEQQIETCQNQINQLQNQIQNTTAQQKQEQINLNVLQNKLKQKETDMQNNQKQQNKVNQQLNELTQQFADLPQKVELQNSRKNELNQEIATLEIKMQELQQQQQDQSQVKMIQDQINEINKNLAPINEQKAKIESQIEISKSSQLTKLNSLIDSVCLIGTNMVNIIDHLNFKSASYDKLVSKAESIHGQLSKYDVNKLKKNKVDVETELKQQQLNLDNVVMQINEITSHRQSNITQNKLLSFLIAQKIPGVYGRLGDLGEINEQLNLAAIAAFGSQLDYIVCENMEVIQNCLHLIRQNNLGFASFIDLEQVTKRYSTSQSQLPGKFVSDNSGYLFLDLVNCEPNVKPAFWHVMGETVITDNNRAAITLNRGVNGKKIRVVTQDGELYERSGSLTGGGVDSLLNRYQGFKKSNIASGSDENDLKSLQKEKEGIEITISNLQRKLEQVNEELNSIQKLQSMQQDLQDQIQEQNQKHYQAFSKILTLIQQLQQINDDNTVIFCSGFVNQTIIQELSQLENVVKNQRQIQQELSDLIPNIIEIVQYYKQQGYTDEVKIRRYLQDNDQLFILQGESDFSNLLQFNNDLIKVLNLTQTQELQQELKVLQVQTENYQIQIHQLNEQLNNQAHIREYQQVRKHLNQCKDQLNKCEQDIQNLEVLKQRFQPSKDRLVQQLSELQEKFTAIQAEHQQTGMQLALSQDNLTKIGSQKEQMNSQLETHNNIMLSLNQQYNTNNELLNQLSGQLHKYNTLIQDNTKQINKLIANIGENEKLFQPATEVLQLLALQLAKAQEVVQYQVPLYSTHENQQELSAFDQFVLTNLSQFKASIKGFSQVNVTTINAKFVNEFRTLTEYQQRVQNLVRQQEIFAQIQQDYDNQLLTLNQLKQNRQETFLNAFNEINSRLREIYRVFSMGGDATLEFVDSFDPFQGISYSVMPPKKAWRSIQNLSGGEKTLSSLSLIFALHQYKKNFIYVVDEIDAALDFRNVSLVANYLKEQARECQFVIISLRNNTFEIADRLIGVYKVNNVSSCVTLDIE